MIVIEGKSASVIHSYENGVMLMKSNDLCYLIGSGLFECVQCLYCTGRGYSAVVASRHSYLIVVYGFVW